MLYDGIVTSQKTGTSPFWIIGFTVVGKPAATVITSSPGWSRRLPRAGEVRAESASRLALDPEFVRRENRVPAKRASSRSNCLA